MKVFQKKRFDKAAARLLAAVMAIMACIGLTPPERTMAQGYGKDGVYAIFPPGI